MSEVHHERNSHLQILIQKPPVNPNMHHCPRVRAQSRLIEEAVAQRSRAVFPADEGAEALGHPRGEKSIQSG